MIIYYYSSAFALVSGILSLGEIMGFWPHYHQMFFLSRCELFGPLSRENARKIAEKESFFISRLCSDTGWLEQDTWNALGQNQAHALGFSSAVGAQIPSRGIFLLKPSARYDAQALCIMAIAKGCPMIIASRETLASGGLSWTPEVKQALEDAGLEGIFIASVKNAHVFGRTFWEALGVSWPQHRLAVTGSDGKTSVSHFVHQLWCLKGFSSSCVGTLGLQLGPHPRITQSLPSGVTTSPPAHYFASFWSRDKAQRDAEHSIFEASSHALDQNRLWGLSVKAGLWTRFSQDHLDYHKTLSRYWQAKAALFARHVTDVAIISSQVPGKAKLMERCPHLKFAFYGPMASWLLARSRGEAWTYAPQILYRVVSAQAKGQWVQVMPCHFPKSGHVDAPKGSRLMDFYLPLLGRFQADNSVAAIAALHSFGCDMASLCDLAGQVKPVLGRMEYVGNYNGGDIYVDYAHTQDGLKSALRALRDHYGVAPSLVFGCGGDRDPFKRKPMGALAQKMCCRVIITDDNPRNEDAHTIRQTISSACPKALIIPCRQEAITRGIEMLEPGQVLLIAGKGHETQQIVGKESYFFSDQLCVAAALTRAKERKATQEKVSD